MPFKLLSVLFLCCLPLSNASAIWQTSNHIASSEKVRIVDLALTTPKRDKAEPRTSGQLTAQTSEQSFAEALQWRILNILTQQLFEDAMLDFSPTIFKQSWHYTARTFEVEIHSQDAASVTVTINDFSKRKQPQVLEIPTSE